VGEIIVGILLGPSLFGALAPDSFALVFRSTPPQPLTILSQVGLLLLMFQIGLEFDFSHLTEKRNRRAVMWVAFAGLAAPFGLGLWFAGLIPAAYAQGSGAPNATAFALFFATSMSITALPILGRIMIEFDLTRTSLGVIAISAAAINDVVGWLALALVTALTTAEFSGGGFSLRVLGVFGFFAVAWWGVRPLLGRWVDAQMSRPLDRDGTGRVWTPGERAPELPPTLMGVVIAAIFVGGMTTYQLGIFAIFGGFTMGVLLHDRLGFVAAWKERVGSFVNVFFLPIFFTYTGLRTDIGSLHDATAWAWCAGVIGVATLGKFGACWLAARVAGLDGPQARVIGIMMNTRALMELIVINVGYDLGVVGREMFTMLVLMAIVSTVVTTPALRRWLPAAGLAPGQGRAAPAGPAGEAA
jgi:Kef-type K+ transport system membrane component KefB